MDYTYSNGGFFAVLNGRMVGRIRPSADNTCFCVNVFNHPAFDGRTDVRCRTLPLARRVLETYAVEAVTGRRPSLSADLIAAPKAPAWSERIVPRWPKHDAVP